MIFEEGISGPGPDRGVYTARVKGIDERVETFFSLRMRHHAGRPTTDNCAETIGINTYSPREMDNYTQTLDKYEIKA